MEYITASALTQKIQKIGFKHPQKIRKVDLIIQSHNATSKNNGKFDSFEEELGKRKK
ncbi:MAG: hypothetical protein AABY40_04605 [Nanoarchaeota archaeon]